MMGAPGTSREPTLIRITSRMSEQQTAPAEIEPADGTTTTRGGLLARGLPRLRAVGPALAGHLAARVLGIVVLAAMAAVAHVSFTHALAKSDGQWYIGIAQRGYAHGVTSRPDGTPVNNNLAFFPAYPLLLRAVAALPGMTPVHAGVAISVLAAVAAAWAIYRIGELLGGRRIGVLLVLLWSTEPAAIVLSMVYTEALFVALAAWSLLALLRGRWVLAGALCAVSGLARSTAPALALAIGVAAAVAIVRRQDGWRPWVGALLSPLGFVGYLAWVGVRLHRWDGWFWMQKQGWHSYFDGGASTARAVRTYLTNDGRIALTAAALIVVVGVALAVLMLLERPRLPAPLLIYTLTLLVLSLGTANYVNSKARFMVPAFPLLVPVARALGRLPARYVAFGLGVLALGSAWFGGFLLVVWKQAI
jgi:hypothetical protein